MFQHLLDRVRSKNVADRRIKIRFFADLYYEMRSFGYGGSAEGPAASVQGMRSPQGEHNPARECAGPPARAQSFKERAGSLFAFNHPSVLIFEGTAENDDPINEVPNAQEPAKQKGSQPVLVAHGDIVFTLWIGGQGTSAFRAEGSLLHHNDYNTSY